MVCTMFETILARIIFYIESLLMILKLILRFKKMILIKSMKSKTLGVLIVVFLTGALIASFFPIV